MAGLATTVSVLIRISARNLVQARRRTALLATAIGLVTMLLVLLMAMSTGIRDSMVQAATAVSGGHVNVAGFYKVNAGEAAPIIDDVARIKEIVRNNTPNLDYMIDRRRGWAKIVSPAGSTQAGVSGIDATEEQRFFERLQLANESEYKEGGRDEVLGDPRRLAEPHTAMLFANQAKTLEVTVGDVVTIQTETFGGKTNTADVTVVAVARDLGMLSSWSVFTSKQQVQELYQLEDDTSGAVWVYLHDIDDADATMQSLRGVFEKEGFKVMEHESAPFFMKFETVAGEDWTGQKLDLTVWRDEVSFLQQVIVAFDFVSWVVILILVVIIAVGIMNTMWNAVRERTREIGTMRAIGMSRRRVLAMFLLEALLLGLFATVMGGLFGAAVAVALDAAALPVPIEAMQFILLSNTIHLVVEPQSLLVAVVVLTLFTVVASLPPSFRAARLPPITALGHAE